MSDLHPGELAEIARELLEGSDSPTSGVWPRACALLARQAIEAALNEFWQRRNVDLSLCSTRAQLICLREYLGDRRLAEETTHTWWALTRACHYYPYELAPTTEELKNWLDVVRNFIEEIRALKTVT